MTTTRIPEAFTFVEEDPELGNMAPSDAWSALVERLEKLDGDEILVRCAFGHSWSARFLPPGEVGASPVNFTPELCTTASCQIPQAVLTMSRKSIDTIRRLAALPDGHRLGRCPAGHEWDADATEPLDVRPEAPAILRGSDGRPACPTCLGPALVCFVSSPLFLGGST